MWLQLLPSINPISATIEKKELLSLSFYKTVAGIPGIQEIKSLYCTTDCNLLLAGRMM
jgi:hypothetical protein